MKWINAEQQVTALLYDEHEEFLEKIMTVEEFLDSYTDEGCPAIYSNPEPKTGRWVDVDYWFAKCSVCGCIVDTLNNATNYCPNCGAKMEG